MNDERWAVLSRKGVVRFTARTPTLKGGELAMRLVFKVPDALFVRPQLQATIELPASEIDRLPEVTASLAETTAAMLGRTPDLQYEVRVVGPEGLPVGSAALAFAEAVRDINKASGSC